MTRHAEPRPRANVRHSGVKRNRAALDEPGDISDDEPEPVEACVAADEDIDDNGGPEETGKISAPASANPDHTYTRLRRRLSGAGTASKLRGELSFLGGATPARPSSNLIPTPHTFSTASKPRAAAFKTPYPPGFGSPFIRTPFGGLEFFRTPLHPLQDGTTPAAPAPLHWSPSMESPFAAVRPEGMDGLRQMLAAKTPAAAGKFAFEESPFHFGQSHR